jgi:penicillin-insensitive murein endopeptidase
MKLLKTVALVLCLFQSVVFAADPPSDLAILPTLPIDLQGGGQAVGPAQTTQKKNPDGSTVPWYGALRNGTLLPAQGEAFVRMNFPETSWGTGMMISLIDQATAYYAKNYSPGMKVYIASIAQQNGGPYGPHKSHQNGLDADILFMGQTRWGSVLDGNNQVTDKFNPQKNWDFWRLLTAQRLLVKGKPTSAVYMILVAPPIKNYLCQWAKDQGLLSDPLNVEVMKRLRATEGHDTHFHMRLNCSPYYPDCHQQGALTDQSCP